MLRLRLRERIKRHRRPRKSRSCPAHPAWVRRHRCCVPGFSNCRLNVRTCGAEPTVELHSNHLTAGPSACAARTTRSSTGLVNSHLRPATVWTWLLSLRRSHANRLTGSRCKCWWSNEARGTTAV